MQERERVLLKQIKSDLFERFAIIPDMLDIDVYLRTLIESFSSYFTISDIHFIIHKQVFKEDQQLFNVLTGEKISYLEDWQVVSYFSETMMENHFPFQSDEKPLLLKNSQGHLKGVILLKFSAKEEIASYSDRFWESCSHICYQYLKNVVQILAIQLGKKRMEILQHVTHQLYATLNLKKIFSGLFASLRDSYPHFLYRIYVAHDEWVDKELPIYVLDFSNDEAPEIQSFLTGDITRNETNDSPYRFLYIPLKGRQGVYGVLEVATNDADLFGNKDIRFLSSLAEITSQAIENAQLYQQSKQLVNNLRLVTEVSRHLNKRLRVSDIGTYFAEELKHSFDAESVAIVLKMGKSFKILDSSSSYFFTINGKGLLKYIQQLFLKGKDAIFVGDISRDSQASYGISSIMSVPLKQDDKTFGFIVLVDDRLYHFSFEEFKLFQSLSHHAALAFANAMLRDELESMVITDYLTKLATRSYLDEKMAQSMENDQKGAFILIDIDNFKRINDLYGHQVGDQVLKQIARIIKRHLYQSDIAARWGGEEIVIYLPNRNLKEGMELAERLVKRIEKETRPQVTISCGVSSWEEGSKDNPRNLFLRADKALYRAKARGKNRAMAYTER